MFTVADMIRELRKPGKIELPVLWSDDVCHMVVDKSDAIDALSGFDSNSASPWVFSRMNGKNRRFDVNE